jgi:hypothetical protein
VTALFASARIVDLILVLVAIEAAALLAYGRATGRGVPPSGLLPNLLSGALLLLALRCALAGTAWEWMALSLGAALVAHLLDLRQRWRG